MYKHNNVLHELLFMSKNRFVVVRITSTTHFTLKTIYNYFNRINIIEKNLLLVDTDNVLIAV